MKRERHDIKTKEFEAAEKAQKAIDIERLAQEFESMAFELEREIALEEARTGVRDTGSAAYSMVAKSAARRRDNLRASIEELTARLDGAKRERDAAFDALARLERQAHARARGSARRIIPLALPSGVE